MCAEARDTVRNAGMLVVQRGVQTVVGVLFSVLIPRLMGPEAYGRYSLIVSLSIWFTLFASLGYVQVLGRYVPQFDLFHDRAHLQKLLGNLLTVRLAGGALTACAYLLLTILWLRDLDRLSLALMGGAVFVRAAAQYFFTVFLGLNQAARWGMGETLRRCLILSFLLLGFILGGLRGACLGTLLAELIVMVIGFWWARPYLSWRGLLPDVSYLAPYIRFGLIFFASDLLLAVFQNSGETLLRVVSSDYVQISYFGLANGIYLMAALAIPQLTLAFAPLLVALLARGETGALKQWVERLLKWLAVGVMLAVFWVLFLGDEVIWLVFGSAYRPVATNLLPLAVALWGASLGKVARVLAIVYERPGEALAAAGIQAAAFWIVGLPLSARYGSVGACLAVLAASMAYGFYFTWRMRAVLPCSSRKWMLAIGLGVLFLPLAWLRSSWMVNAALCSGAVIGYGGLLFLLRVVTPGEIAALWQAVRPRRAVPSI